jgi:uncharacterized protein (TIGR02266 family)
VAASDQGPATKTPVSLRIKLSYADVATFVDKFAVHVTRGGVFLASRAPKPVGTKVRFELLLADGKSKVLKGDGVVVWIKPYDAAHPNRSYGMGLKFSKLDAESHKLVERMLARKLEKGAKDEPGATTPGADGGDSSPPFPRAASEPGLWVPTTPRAASEPGIAAPREAATTPTAEVTPPPSPIVHEPMTTPMPDNQSTHRQDDLLSALASASGIALDVALDRARTIAQKTVALGLSELPELAELLTPKTAANAEDVEPARGSRYSSAEESVDTAPPHAVPEAQVAATGAGDLVMEAGEPDEYDVHVAHDEDTTAPLDMSVLTAGDAQGVAPAVSPPDEQSEATAPMREGVPPAPLVHGSADANLDADIDAALDLVIDVSEVPGVSEASESPPPDATGESLLSGEDDTHKKGFFKKLFRK